jgi:ABC transporter substrate binding protein
VLPSRPPKPPPPRPPRPPTPRNRRPTSSLEHLRQIGAHQVAIASLPDLFRRGASYVHRILQGSKPADLPVEQPTKFELVINVKTAKALGLAIPESFLLRADELIE